MVGIKGIAVVVLLTAALAFGYLSEVTAGEPLAPIDRKLEVVSIVRQLLRIEPFPTNSGFAEAEKPDWELEIRLGPKAMLFQGVSNQLQRLDNIDTALDYMRMHKLSWQDVGVAEVEGMKELMKTFQELRLRTVEALLGVLEMPFEARERFQLFTESEGPYTFADNVLLVERIMMILKEGKLRPADARIDPPKLREYALAGFERDIAIARDSIAAEQCTFTNCLLDTIRIAKQNWYFTDSELGLTKTEIHQLNN